MIASSLDTRATLLNIRAASLDTGAPSLNIKRMSLDTGAPSLNIKRMSLDIEAVPVGTDAVLAVVKRLSLVAGAVPSQITEDSAHHSTAPDNRAGIFPCRTLSRA